MRDGITIYFVRHGETDWNAERRYQGQREVPLNARGREQARRNGERLIELRHALAGADYVSSPMGRARETMEIVRRSLGLPPETYRLDHRLRELSYGHWEGALQDDLAVIDPQGMAERARDPLRWRPQDGESYADLLVRTRDWLGTVERDTVVVSHGGVSRCVRALLMSLDAEEIPVLETPQDRVLVITRGAMHWM